MATDFVKNIKSMNSNEWFTPPEILALAREALGGPFDLDPASCKTANKTVQATWYFTQQDDGLSRTWTADRVWCNPPYAGQQKLWTRKMIDEYRVRHFTQGLLLVPASVGTAWFQELFDYPIFFKKGRIRFSGPNKANSGPTIDSALIYFGENFLQFYEVFDKRMLGRVVWNA
jgi:phage N-6-adenine-methyltransferase